MSRRGTLPVTATNYVRPWVRPVTPLPPRVLLYDPSGNQWPSGLQNRATAASL
jgi:hypothetical protein